MQKGSSVGIYTYNVFARFGPDLYAQSVLINRISASELSQKFIRSALLVGYVIQCSTGDRSTLRHQMYYGFRSVPVQNTTCTVFCVACWSGQWGLFSCIMQSRVRRRLLRMRVKLRQDMVRIVVPHIKNSFSSNQTSPLSSWFQRRGKNFLVKKIRGIFFSEKR